LKGLRPWLIFNAGNGNDTLNGGDDNDIVNGGNGNDTR
jgi:Ca2+-binding RTX toxin-like protein